MKDKSTEKERKKHRPNNQKNGKKKTKTLEPTKGENVFKKIRVMRIMRCTNSSLDIARC